jgi:hypothetical protein
MRNFLGRNWRTIVAIFLAAGGLASLFDYIEAVMVDIVVSANTGFGHYSASGTAFLGCVLLFAAVALLRHPPAGTTASSPSKTATAQSPDSV